MVPISGGDPRWFVVQTQPHQERRAETQLGRQGFTTYLPLLAATERRGSRFTTAARPLFPSYIFVSLRLPGDRWRSINGTFGVARLLAAGDEPTPVPRGIVEELRAAEAADGVLSTTVRVGDTVRLTHGPFAGLVGRLLQLDPGGRARVLLSIMGGAAPVALPAGLLAPAA